MPLHAVPVLFVLSVAWRTSHAMPSNGESTFWSRIERLAPPGYAICTFGL